MLMKTIIQHYLKKNIYKYRKTIENTAEKLDYLYEVDCYSGTVNQ